MSDLWGDLKGLWDFTLFDARKAIHDAVMDPLLGQPGPRGRDFLSRLAQAPIAAAIGDAPVSDEVVFVSTWTAAKAALEAEVLQTDDVQSSVSFLAGRERFDAVPRAARWNEKLRMAKRFVRGVVAPKILKRLHERGDVARKLSPQDRGMVRAAVNDLAVIAVFKDLGVNPADEYYGLLEKWYFLGRLPVGWAGPGGTDFLETWAAGKLIVY